jgi:hypothetical protein
VSAAQRPAARQRLRVRAIVVILLLVLQYFTGMVANLYVAVPAHHPGANAHNYFTGAASSVGWAISSGFNVWLAVHVALGLFLGLATIEFTIAAFRSHNAIWAWFALAGAAFMIGAGFNGASFLVFNKDYSSLIMAGLFGLSLSSYVLGMYLDGRAAA